MVLYLLKGLSSSPLVQINSYSSRDYPLNETYCVHNVFVGKRSVSVFRHNHFKCSFACVDPMILHTDQKKYPKYNVHPFLKYRKQISKQSLFIGSQLSCDEHTVGFHGNQNYKERISYKEEGDGSLRDFICSKGYTFAFHL